MKSFMDVESNGLAVSSTCSNIAIANQFLLTTRAIVDAWAPGLHVT
jgi:hypothetical protein